MTWDEALDDIAARLTAIRDQYGAKALALGKGTRSGTSVGDVERWLGRFLYLLVVRIGYQQRMFATGIGTPGSVTPSATSCRYRM